MSNHAIERFRWVVAIRKGDESALARLYDSTCREVGYYAAQRLIDRADTDDVVAEAYAEFCAQIDTIDARQDILAWLTAAAERIALRYNRARRACAVKTSDDSPQGADDAYAMLDERERRLFDAYFVHRYPLRKIARQLQLSRTEAQAQIDLLVAKMRRFLAQRKQ